MSARPSPSRPPRPRDPEALRAAVARVGRQVPAARHDRVGHHQDLQEPADHHRADRHHDPADHHPDLPEQAEHHPEHHPDPADHHHDPQEPADHHRPDPHHDPAGHHRDLP